MFPKFLLVGFVMIAACVSGCVSGPKFDGARTAEPTKPLSRKEKDAKRQKESVCGQETDWHEAETFPGSKPISKSVIDRAGRRTVRLVLKRAEVMREMIGNMFPGTKPEDIELAKYLTYEGEGWCTGSLLDRSTIITASHCFQNGANTPSVYVDNIPVSLTPWQLATLFEVHAGYQFVGGTRTRRPGSRSAVQSLKEYGPEREGGLDYAILAIAPFEVVTPMTIHTAPIAPESKIAIVHHPLGLPKKVSVGKLDYYGSGGGMYYIEADTEDGSSGAGLLDQKGRLIGVHTSGGCKTAGNNAGLSMSAIRSVSSILKRR